MTWPNLPNWAYPALTSLLAVLALLIVLLRPRRKQAYPRLELSPRLDDVETVNTAAARILEQVAHWVPGTACYAYWLDAGGEMLQLRASLAPSGNPPVVPDYSGLIIEETPLAPLTLKPAGETNQARVCGTKAEPWLEIPFGNRLLVRVGLKEGQEVPEPLLQRLSEAGRTYAPLAVAVHEWFKAREALEEAATTTRMTRAALDTTLRPERAIELLLQVAGRLVESSEQCAVLAGSSDPLVISDTAAGRELGELILNGETPELTALSTEPDIVPGSALGRLGQAYNACVRIPVAAGGEILGCFFCFTKGATALDDYQAAVLRALGERTANLVSSQRHQENLSQDYLATLRALVNAMDSLSRHTIGSSDRMARYARLTALELGLPPGEAGAVAMAAFFHDIGSVAIDQRLLTKPGRFTPMDYAEIKIHPEIGAMLVAPVQSHPPLGPMVAGHHERWDGHGYHQGLKGEEIPLGARIISVVDLFEAKTTGRPYRSPLPFNRALEDVKAAAGTQLDPRVISAFLAAMEKERRGAKPGLPPRRCWELKQMPGHACGGCLNRVQAVTRCWENTGRRCEQHGDQCETCLVHTEVVSR